jgi:threonine/homoserine/homoserine lactone efflux protein
MGAFVWLNQFWQGLAFGMVLQLSVGPVCVSVLQTGIAHSFRPAFIMTVGVVLADSVYVGLALLGISELMQVPAGRVGIGLAGAALLLYFGGKNLLATEAQPTATARARGGWSNLRYGFLLTLCNPLTILFWAGVFGGMIASASFASPLAIYVFGGGCVVATLVFLTIVAAVGKFIGRMVRPGVVLWLNRVTGLFLIGFAVKLALGVFGN